MSRIIASILSLALLLSANSFVYAQETASSSVPASVQTFYGPLNCFDYFKTDSVKVAMTAVSANTLPGVSLQFRGTIQNANTYPLTDGVLYAKVYRDVGTDEEGPGSDEVVDAFVVKEKVALASGASLEVTHDWIVPVNIDGGEYYISYYFLDAKLYELLGISTDDNRPGAQVAFEIKGDSEVVKIDKAKTTVNNEAYNFVEAVSNVPKEDPIQVSITLTNPTDQLKRIPLQWQQYAWDSLSPENNHRGTKTQLAELQPGETKIFTYNATEQVEPVYYITATIQDVETKSLVSLKVQREDVAVQRFVFAGLDTFPITPGTPLTVAACVLGSVKSTEGNTLTLTLTDREGVTIHEYKYEGGILPSLNGFGEEFSLDAQRDYLKLTAKLERNGEVLHEVIKEYDCALVDASKCIGTESEASDVLGDWLNKTTTIIIIGVLILIILIVVLYKMLRRRRKQTSGFPEYQVIDGVEMKMPEN